MHAAVLIRFTYLALTALLVTACDSDTRTVHPDSGTESPPPDTVEPTGDEGASTEPGDPDADAPGTDATDSADLGGTGTDATDSTDPENTPPTLTAPATLALDAGGEATVDFAPLVEDAQSPDEELVLSAEAAHLSLDVQGLAVTITAPGGWTGTDTVLVTATDPGGLGATATIEVSVSDEPPDPPGPACGVHVFTYTPLGAVGAVFVAGSFNGWNAEPATGDALADEDGDGTWELALDIGPGHHTYKFVVDGEWLVDPANPQTEDDGFGANNSVVDLPECGGLVLTAHSTSPEGVFTAHFDAPSGGVTSADVSVTVDWAPSAAVVVTGAKVTVTTAQLPSGIHDVRVTHPGGTLLLKVYVGISTDWRDVTIYFAMTDRFSNGDPTNDAPVDGVDWRTNYQGGDFAGITQRVEDGYFDALGVGALWISWPVDNLNTAESGGYPAQTGCGLNPKEIGWSPVSYTAYHGYWPSELDQVEERFGTLTELQDLVATAHAHGIRVLLDFTANHVHDSSPFYADHAGEGWFNLPAQICQDVGWDTAPTTCWFTDYLPDLNYNHPAAREAVVNHAREWVLKSGADGFRFDAVKHLEMSFVEALRAMTKAEFELTGVDFYIVGETFTGDAGLIQSFVGPTRIHGQFDFPTNSAILAGFGTQKQGLDAMDGQVRGVKSVYTDQGALMSTFIGNHDIARFVSLAAGHIPCGPWDVVSNIAQGWHEPPGTPDWSAPYEQLRLALTYAMTIPGLPLIYYGDELGLPGAGDPDNRRMMLFGSALSQLQKETLAFTQALGQARAQSPALRRGSWSAPLWSEPDFLAYARSDAESGQVAVILLNRGGSPKSGQLTLKNLTLPDGTAMTELLYGGTASPSGGKLSFEVPARSAQIWVSPGG